MARISSLRITLSVVMHITSVIISINSEVIINNYVCTKDFCQQYVETTGCEALPESCRVQNATMNGIILPSQTPCSCCDSCLENSKKGDDCTVGLIGAPVPSTVCGPDLTCTRGIDEEHSTCQTRLNTTCLTDVRSFNEGMVTGDLGNLMVQPDCSNLGEFNAFKCIPGQICFCVDKWGERIFGETLFVTGISILMRCQCSREEVNARSVLRTDDSNQFIRCNEMGSYDRLQCIHGKCVCVDPHTGSPTSPVYNQTNLEDLQREWKCFDANQSDIFRPCEDQKSLLMTNPPGFLSARDLSQMCQPDGFFSRIQRNETHYYCVDKFGKQINKYGHSLSDNELNPINCNCARVVDLLRKNNRVEYPQCCPNGNYKRINCRRGFCFCVNKNGQQTTPEVPRSDKSRLQCTDNITTIDNECN